MIPSFLLRRHLNHDGCRVRQRNGLAILPHPSKVQLNRFSDQTLNLFACGSNRYTPRKIGNVSAIARVGLCKKNYVFHFNPASLRILLAVVAQTLSLLRRD